VSESWYSPDFALFILVLFCLLIVGELVLAFGLVFAAAWRGVFP
jgi:hypothetical protein